MSELTWPLSPTFGLKRCRQDGLSVDFYLGQAPEVPVFGGVMRELRGRGVDARLVLEPPLRNTARCVMPEKGGRYMARCDDTAARDLMTPVAYRQCLALLEGEGLRFEDRARAEVDAAVTTGAADTLARYVGLRLKLVARTSFCPWQDVPEWDWQGFDGALVPGPFAAARLRRWLPEDAIIAVGSPMDGASQEEGLVQADFGVTPDRPLLAYCPGWGERGTVEAFADALKTLSETHNVWFIPDYLTTLFERERIARLANRLGVPVAENCLTANRLFSVADLVLADAHSSRSGEAMLLDKTLVVLALEPGAPSRLLDGVASAFPICHNPERLQSTVREALADGFSPAARRAWKTLFFRDHRSSGAVAAADAVVDLVQRKARPFSSVSTLRLKGAPPDGTLFSVIVPTHNRRDILSKCLTALEAQTLPVDRFEVLVCDDGSTDATASYLSSLSSSLTLACLRQENKGPAAARNMGLKRVRGRYVLMLNDDAIAAPDLIENHYKAHLLHSEGNLAVLGSFSFPASYRESLLGYLLEEGGLLFAFNRNMRPHRYHDYRHFYTCNISLPRDLLETVGGFDEEFRLPAGEDTELGYRLEKEHRCGVLHAPECASCHEHPQTINMFCETQYTRGLAQPLLYAKHPDMFGGDGGEQLRGYIRQQYSLMDPAGIRDYTSKFAELESPRVRECVTRSGLGNARFYELVCSMAPLLKAIGDHHFFRGHLDSPLWRGAPER